MSKKPKRIRRTFSDEFKQDAINLVVKQGYSFAAAAKAVDVSSRSLREWHANLHLSQKLAVKQPHLKSSPLRTNVFASSFSVLRWNARF